MKRTKIKPGPKAKDDSRIIPLTFKVNRYELNMINGLTRVHTGTKKNRKGDRSEFIRMRIFEGKRMGVKAR